ncbi:MAG TPA: DinB family protein [Kofleriaceae bacterium]|nr:DinB family protein [Kofleriaceae bacterium]
MSLRAQYEANARYNRWMNERLYALAATLSDDDRKRDLGAFFKSIHGTFNHLLLADRVWLSRLAGGPAIQITSLAEELYADFDELRRERARTDDAIDAFVRGLDDAALAANVRYVGRGRQVEHPMWWAVGHMFNHQTHHRGQITTLLMQLGHDPGSTDLIALLRGP